MDQKVILLFGGDSDERLVSVASAQAMANAVVVAKYWFWHKEGQIFELDYQQLIDHKDPFTSEFIPTHSPIFNHIKTAISSQLTNQHIFLLAVHGGSGENGLLQTWLEEANCPFTGSDAIASQMAFDKLKTKERLFATATKLAPHLRVDISQGRENIKSLLHKFFKQHGSLIIKPNCGGSSIGNYFLRSPNDIDQFIEHWAPNTSSFIVEKVINGKELTVGVIEHNGKLMALPCTEIKLDDEREFDYQGKYLGVGSKEITPANISQDATRKAQALAISAHRQLGLSGYSRTDMILGHDGCYFLETNTLPGLSRQSVMPQQLAVIGISMADFLNAQIELAVSRAHNMKNSWVKPQDHP